MKKLKIGYIALIGTYISKGQYFAGAKVYNTAGRARAANKGATDIVPAFIEVPEDQYEEIKDRNYVKD